ncbi:MAG: ankyrin repeat domain-containing protein, partial [Pyrinomonadaceae bacterium]
LNELLTEQNASIIDLLAANGEPVEAMNEAFAWACFTDRTVEADILLKKGVDPAAGDKTGLSGFHWAASRGNVETVRMLIRRNAPLEQLNMYEGTVLGQTLWSAVNEAREGQAEVIETLIEAGAQLEHGTLEWWEKQDVPSAETKTRVANALRNA